MPKRCGKTAISRMTYNTQIEVRAIQAASVKIGFPPAVQDAAPRSKGARNGTQQYRERRRVIVSAGSLLISHSSGTAAKLMTHPQIRKHRQPTARSTKD